MAEQTEAAVTKDEARAAREKIRAYWRARREEKAGRDARRAERATEIADHKQAAADADELIDALHVDLDVCVREERAVTEQIAALRAKQRERAAEHKKIAGMLARAYADRKAARDALAALSAEIRG